MAHNQFDETRQELAPEIEWVRTSLAAGERPSLIAQMLHDQGIKSIRLLLVFLVATKVSLAELKGLGQWYGESGVLDSDAFDSYARDLFT